LLVGIFRPEEIPRDREVIETFKKLVGADLCRRAGEDPDPLMPEEMEKAIREMPRDAEVIDLLKKLSDEGPLPAR
jgi:hypothetical protein